MKKTAAALARHALEQLGITHTFGIPGVHNTELYDELGASPSITPVLVAHEVGASFGADAMSRVGASIGCCLIVPAAGVTHAASGIAEAHLDGIPMLVIAGGVRNDTGHKYQLHAMDQHALLKPITKATFTVETHEAVIPTLYEAYRIAVSGVPGPVFVEIPVNLQLIAGEVASLPAWDAAWPAPPAPDADAIERAARLLSASRKPGLFVGWGAREATAEIARIAELLGAPVATTLQGLSVFPASHRLHVGMGYSIAAVPAATKAFADCDAMLAVGLRFAEIPTGSFGAAVPAKLVHIDIDEQVIGANHPPAVGIVADARAALAALVPALERALGGSARDGKGVAAQIQADKAAYRAEWLAHQGEGVNPQVFFDALRRHLPDDGIVVTDDGNHTFLAAELMPIHAPKGFICPTDFNAMGYCVPAVNAAKLARPEAVVVGIVGDGALLMTGMEAITAAANRLGVVYFVFADGELSQIAQAQEIPYNRKTCAVLGTLDVAGLAQATGCGCLRMERGEEADAVVKEALARAARGEPMFVDVRIDYSKRTRFTQGAVKTNLKRFDTPTKLRFIGRALWRKVTG